MINYYKSDTYPHMLETGIDTVDIAIDQVTKLGTMLCEFASSTIQIDNFLSPSKSVLNLE